MLADRRMYALPAKAETMRHSLQETFSDPAGAEEFQQLQKLLSLPTFEILDECDELLSPKFQLVYAWGSQQDLPAMTERVHILQAVVQALQDDLNVATLLNNGAAARVQVHRGHYGGMPEIRLLAGVPVWCMCDMAIIPHTNHSDCTSCRDGNRVERELYSPPWQGTLD